MQSFTLSILPFAMLLVPLVFLGGCAKQADRGKPSMSKTHASDEQVMNLGISATQSSAPLKQAFSAAQEDSEVDAENSRFQGRYEGMLQQTYSTLVLKQNEDKVSGEINANGYIYRIEGVAENGDIKGKFFDSGTGAVLPCTASLDGSTIRFDVEVFNPRSGESQHLKLTFSRESTALTDKRLRQNAGGSEQALHNPIVVGRWRHTYAQGSDGYSIAVDTWMIVNADGTYEYGEGKAAGEGLQVEGGPTSRGHWRTHGQYLHFKEAGAQHWVPLARYYVEANKMLLTYGDGEREIWYRM